ncbi:MAG: hypothetical protein GY820_07205 [Gammaproteobacteria bacterium]|nr:hypothetical protein [Gammaproteobacteria bacterium]
MNQKTTEVNASIRKSITQITSLLKKYEKYVKELSYKIGHIDSAGLEKGTPNWKKDKYGNSYLRLIRPSLFGQREFKYVGSKKEKIAEAFAGIDRFRQQQILLTKRESIMIAFEDLDSDINLIKIKLENLVYEHAEIIENLGTDFSIDLTGGIDQIDIEHIRP